MQFNGAADQSSWSGATTQTVIHENLVNSKEWRRQANVTRRGVTKMAVWLVRAGEKGEMQDFALDNSVAVVGWDDMPDLSTFSTREEMEAHCQQVYPTLKPKTIKNWVSQLWAFSKRIQLEDLVALPLKGQDVIAIGKILGDYKYLGNNPAGAKHTRPVSWIVQDMPRSRLDQDLLYSLGAFMTVCQIQRNNAEARIKAALSKPSAQPIGVKSNEIEAIGGVDDSVAVLDLEEYAATQIRAYVAQKFTGHRLADIVDAILRAQGYQTELSPPGPDGGVDIIAGRGPMGFDPPRLCVQVKSGDHQQDVKVLRELKGTMKDFNADQGLFVSWGGFKRTVKAEARRQFFEIRLWDAADVVAEVQRYYDQFTEDLKADLPLKRIWLLVPEDS